MAKFDEFSKTTHEHTRINNTSIGSMLKQLHWLSINQLACEQRLMQVWKSISNEDYCLHDMFKPRENQRETRSAGTKKLQINFRTKLREASFHFPSVRLWNSAPEEVTNAPTESQAKTAIRKFVLTLPR